MSSHPAATRLSVGLVLLLGWTSACSAGRERCGAFPTFADGLSPSTEIHVATTGSNTTGNGTLANPYATISFAASQARPGSAVIVHPGAYSGGTFLIDLHGTAVAPIWLGGVVGEPRPLISGGTEGLHLVRPRYVIVHDLEVAGCTGNGINADDGGEYENPLAAHHVLFKNLLIHDIGGTGNQDGLKLSGLNDFAVIDCDIAHCGGGNSGSGIDMVGCHHGFVVRCFLHDFDGSGNAVQCKGGSEDVEIRWCRILNAGQRALNVGGSTGFEFFRPPLSTTRLNFEAKGIRVIANIIEGANASVAFVGCIQSMAANNTIVDPHNWIVRILQETTTSGSFAFAPCGDNAFVNNLVYFDRSDLSTYINIGPNTAAASFTFSHNLWYAHDNPALSTPALPVEELGGIYAKDPLLADPAASDYHLQPGSPAAGAGQALAAVGGDYDGTCYGRPPAIGAFELSTLSGDIDGDGDVNVNDLLAVISEWGPCPRNCIADVMPPEGNGVVNVDDLLVVINGWTG